jgi:hypothetical protein
LRTSTLTCNRRFSRHNAAAPPISDAGLFSRRVSLCFPKRQRRTRACASFALAAARVAASATHIGTFTKSDGLSSRSRARTGRWTLDVDSSASRVSGRAQTTVLVSQWGSEVLECGEEVLRKYMAPRLRARAARDAAYQLLQVSIQYVCCNKRWARDADMRIMREPGLLRRPSLYS